MDKPQQKHGMKAPVRGAAHSLSSHPKAPHVPVHLPQSLGRHFSQHAQHPAQWGHSPQLWGFRHYK